MTSKQRMESTPMAPYIGLLQSMTPEEKRIVVTFLTESMHETQEPKSNSEIIREKYKNLDVSPELKQLRGCIKLTEEDLKDERIKHILDQ